MSKVTYTVSTSEKGSDLSQLIKSITHDDSQLQVTAMENSLEPREMAFVTIPYCNRTGVWTADQLTVNDKFIVEVKPPVGAALPIARTMPSGMTAGTCYEVF